MPAPIPINDQILALHEAGVATRQIAAVIGTLSRSAVARRLKKLTPRKTTEIYKELRADVLAEKQRALLMQSCHADPREQDQLSRAFKVYHEAERLTRDLSTANVAQAHKLTDEMAALIGAITGRGSGAVDKPVDK